MNFDFRTAKDDKKILLGRQGAKDDKKILLGRQGAKNAKKILLGRQGAKSAKENKDSFAGNCTGIVKIFGNI